MLDTLLESLITFGRVFLGMFCLGLCVFVHELGHFLAARKRGLLVSRFSIGFGPRVFGWTRGGVDYRLSLIPFGGYVALPQLADMGGIEGDKEGSESFGNSSQDLPKISYTDKMIVSVMGAVFNLIFAFILSLALWAVGQEISRSFSQTKISVVPTVENEEGTEIPSPAAQAGILTGDSITHVDGVAISDWQDLSSRIVTGIKRTDEGLPLTELTILRNGDTLEIPVTPILATKEGMRRIGVTQILMLEVGEPIDASLIDQVQTGDTLVSINGVQDFGVHELPEILENNEASTALMTFSRDGNTFDVPISFEKVERAGGSFFYDFGLNLISQSDKVYPNPITQFAEKMEMMYLTLRGLLHRNSDVKVRNMSGPVGIIDNFQESVKYGLVPLGWLLVFVNINLAIMNVMPLPVLDGGHMMFATLAKLRGKPLPRVFMEKIQIAFAMFLFSFIIYVTFFDLGRVADKF
ncbi:MAG: RIP metalloprotease RseP [Verrucomicrobiota bacterium]